MPGVTQYSPIAIPRGKYFGSNFWEVFSPKLQRIVSLFSDLEYEHWILVETNPDVVDYCEQPLRINQMVDEKLVESVFDMWIRLADGSESFVEIKYWKDVDPSSFRSSSRVMRQTRAQRLWCESNGFNYTLLTEREIRANPVLLSNMKSLVPYVRNRSQVIDIDKHVVLNALKNGPTTIHQLSEVTKIHRGRVMECVAWLVYTGQIKSNLEIEPLSVNTEVW